MGESAGSWSVLHHMLAPGSSGLFSKGINFRFIFSFILKIYVTLYFSLKKLLHKVVPLLEDKPLDLTLKQSKLKKAKWLLIVPIAISILETKMLFWLVYNHYQLLIF